MLQDGARAVRLVRASAADWKIDRNAWASSIVAATSGFHVDDPFDLGNPDAADPVERQSSRPDLGILCYPSSRWVSTRIKHPKHFCWDQSAAGTGQIAVQRIAGDDEHAAVFHLADLRGQDGAGGEQPAVCRALRKSACRLICTSTKGRHGLGLDDKPPFAHPHPWAGDCCSGSGSRDL